MLERVGGKAFVHTLVEIVPATANVRQYAEIVRETSVLRQLIRAGQEIAELGYEHPDVAAELLDAAERKVYALADRDGGRGVVDACDSLRGCVESLRERREGRRLRRVRCGFEMIDRVRRRPRPRRALPCSDRALGLGEASLRHLHRSAASPSPRARCCSSASR